MPRATLVLSNVSLAGVVLATVTPIVLDGVQFQNNGKQILFVDNGGVAPINLTIDMDADRYGRDGTKVIAILAGEKRYIGPFLPLAYNQDGYVLVDFSAATSVLVGVLSLQS